MKSFALRSSFFSSYISTHYNSNLTTKHPSFQPKSSLSPQNPITKKSPQKTKISPKPILFDSDKVKLQPQDDNRMVKISSFPVQAHGLDHKSSRYVMMGAISVGFVMFLMGFDDHQKAMAFGPEGPLMEDFWDNMRRYGLYALTVSTGVLYAVFQPLYELLKNPISAILVLTILGGGFYIVTQVVSAMIGVTEFSYDYNY